MVLPEQSEIMIIPSSAVAPAEVYRGIANQEPRSILRDCLSPQATVGPPG